MHKMLKIKKTINDTSIIIPIGGSANLLGYDDNVQKLVNAETESSINIASDLEVRRFSSNVITNILATFYFWSGSSYVSPINPESLAPYDFAANGLDNTSEEVRNSFYVMQVFDSSDEAIQKKLHTGYFNGYDFTQRSSELRTQYVINNELTEFLSIYINNSFIEEKNSPTPIDLYVKFLFYSAQSAKYYPFSRSSSTVQQSDIYTEIKLDTATFKYSITGTNFNGYEIVNPDYATLINNTVPSIPVEKPTYPIGNTFDIEGNYETI